MFRLIFEQAAVGVAQIETATGRFRQVNQRYADIVGYSRQELEQLDFQTLTSPEDLPPDLENMRRLVTGELSDFAMEKRYRRKDGSIVWVHLTVSPLWAPGEQPEFHLAVVEDITARKLAEASLSERVDELAALNAVGRAVNESLALEQTKAAALNGMLDAVRPDLAFLFLREGERLILDDVQPSDARSRLGAIPEHRVGACICGLAVTRNEPQYAHDIGCDARCTWEECKRAGIRSFAALPLARGDEVFGVIGLASDADRDFGKQAGFLETLAGQVSVALQNARLHESTQRELADRQHAEANHARLTAMLENTTDLAGIATADGRMTYLNRAGRELVGWGVSESVADHVLGDVHPAWAMKIIESVGLPTAARSGHWKGETAIVHRDGREICVSQVLLAHHSPQGALEYFSTFMRDITDRKLAEEALRESEARLSLVFNNSHDMQLLVAVEPDGELRIVAANRRYFDTARKFGLALATQQIVGRTVECVFRDPFGVTGPQLDAKLRNYRQAISSRTPVHYEEDVETTAGHFFSEVTILPVFDDVGTCSYLLWTSHDITERKQSELALNDGRDRLRSIFRAAPTGIGVTVNRQFTEVNERVCEMTGYAQHELVGASARMLYLTDEDYEYVGVEKYRQIVERRTGTVETRWRRKDGSIIEVLLSSTPIDALEHAKGITFTALDITERKRAEAERERLQAQLTQAQKMESVGRLAGGVAHDFNNMLQSILGNASLALQDLPPGSPVRESLEEIQKSALRSADLTRQLLAFARKQPIAPRSLDLNDTIAGMLKMLRRLIGEDIELSWHPGTDLWPVRMDPTQVDQVLANLCINARDAIAGTGEVTIHSGNVTLGRAYAESHPGCMPGDYVMLTVSDTGHGIDGETRSHLFEPFFTTKEVGKGTGLGLATVFGIVQQNSGLIDVVSEPNHGTTFKLYFPRALETAVEPSPRRLGPLHGTETVLLVEDEEQVLSLGQRVLELYGYTVLSASTPKLALELAAACGGPIHLLLTDVVMPGMNGRALRELLRGPYPEMKCLFMSGYTADVIARHGELEEGVMFLQKPFTVDALAAKVRDVLNKP